MALSHLMKSGGILPWKTSHTQITTLIFQYNNKIPVNFLRPPKTIRLASKYFLAFLLNELNKNDIDIDIKK